ncbi:MAG: hypothetical protein IIW34_08035 [Clostridia bacterium]|nr:hypothetical protein [Clostridia bacterium]MBQ5814082.1 hypothetical protein [Clostridia bacterium]
MITEMELKKLGRGDLLELLLTQGKENEELRFKLKAAEDKLASREVAVREAGSLAEAVAMINGLMESAQKTADYYLDNIKMRAESHESLIAKLESESMQKADTLVKDAEEKCAAMIKDAEEKAAVMVREAEEKKAQLETDTKQQVDAYWKEVSTKLEEFYQSHRGLKELLNAIK